MLKKQYFLICFILTVVNSFSSPIRDNYTNDLSENKSFIVNNPYENKGPLHLKGSMHNHTTNSDGIFDPYSTAILIRDEGNYDFYTFTDHNFVTNDPEIPGIIWMGNALEDTKNTQHLLIYNLPENYIYINKGTNINNLVSYYYSLGAVVSYAHPDWSRQYQSDKKILSIEHIDFVEVINGVDSGSERAFDLLLSKNIPVLGFAVDDFHSLSHINRDYLIVFAEEKDKESIWDAILSGCFYMASRGMEIDIFYENNTITVFSNQPSTFEFIGLNKENPSEGLILHTKSNTEEASYTIIGNEGYVRVKVSASVSSGVAFTQPFVIISD